MKKLVIFILGALLSLPILAKTKEIRIDGGISTVDLNEVRKLIKEIEEDSAVNKVSVGITSPGGEATAGFTIAKLFRRLSTRGIAVEIHASGMCMSACTWILASGTPGLRFIEKDTLVLVHPVQFIGRHGLQCISYVEKPTDVDEKVGNAYLELARDLYMEFTGRDLKTVQGWMTCGREQVGRGKLAVQLGMADKIED